MKKAISALAVLALLIVGATSANAFPSTYAISHSTSYAGNVGAAQTPPKWQGTVYITATITGHMTIPSCPSQYMHTPSIAIKLPNGTTTARVYGSPVQACNNINFTHVFAFDLSTVGCIGDMLDGGSCAFESEGQVECPIMGLIQTWVNPISIEWAWTRVQVLPTTCYYVSGGGVRCGVQAFCQNCPGQPDFKPTDIFTNQFGIANFPPFWLTGSVGFSIAGSPFVFPAAEIIGYLPNGGPWWTDFLAPAVPWNGNPFTCTCQQFGCGSIIPWPF